LALIYRLLLTLAAPILIGALVLQAHAIARRTLPGPLFVRFRSDFQTAAFL